MQVVGGKDITSPQLETFVRNLTMFRVSNTETTEKKEETYNCNSPSAPKIAVTCSVISVSSVVEILAASTTSSSNSAANDAACKSGTARNDQDVVRNWKLPRAS